MNLLVFNIRTDAEHPTQAITVRWLNEFSLYYKKIYVITIHAGRFSLPDNVTVYPLKKGNIGRFVMILRFYYLLLYLLSKKKVNAVFVHQAVLLGALGGPILFFKKIPMVMWRSHKSRSFSLWVCHFFSRAVVSSSMDAFPFASRKLIITGHGIDTASFSPADKMKKNANQPFTIGYVGRYSPVKRIETLLKAVYLLLNKGHNNLKVYLYGLTQNSIEEKYFDYLKDLRKELKIQNEVLFHPSVNNWEVPGLFAGFDLVVSQQETGGTDKAVLEAMSCGIPVVMATTSFNQYLLEDKASKLVFSSGLAREMAEKIEGIMRLKGDERLELGMTLRRIVEDYHSLSRLSEKVNRILKATDQGYDWKRIIDEERRENDL